MTHSPVPATRPRTMAPAHAAAFAEGASLAVVLFLLPVYAAKEFGSHRLVATEAIVALPAVAVLFASNAWGAAADVLGRSLPLVALGLAGYAATFVALAFARSLEAALAIVLAGACVYAAAAPLVRSYVTMGRGSARAGRALAVVLFFEAMGLAVANLLANARYSSSPTAADTHRVLLGAAIVALAGSVAVLASAGSERRRPRLARGTGGVARALFGDLAELYASRPLRAIVGVAFPTFAGQFVYVGLINLLLRDHWHLAPSAVGRVLASHAALSLLIYPLAGRLADAHGGRRTLVWGAMGQAVKFALLFAAPSAAFAAAAAVLPMFPLVTTGSAAAIAETSLDTRRSGGMGILTGALAAGAAAGPLLGGAVADAAGLSAAPLLAATLAGTTVAAGALAGFLVKRVPVDTPGARF